MKKKSTPKRPVPRSLPSLHKWLEQHRRTCEAVVFDIDGVVILGHKPLAGSDRLFDTLRGWKVPFVLLTNDGSHSTQEKSRYLKRLRIHVKPDEIISCSDGLTDFVRRHPAFRGRTFFVMGRLGKPCFATAAGLKVTRQVKNLPKCAGVIVGEHDYDWGPVIHGVINFLVRHPAAPLVVPNPDEYFMIHGRLLRIGAGGLARLIQRVLKSYGLTVRPVYLGKPYQPIFLRCHGILEEREGRRLRRDRVLMVGDSLTSDIQGARRFGYRSALLLTGVTRSPMVAKAGIRPDLVFKNI